jgi:hypothetical protein
MMPYITGPRETICPETAEREVDMKESDTMMIDHGVIAAFGAERVNLPREDASTYREQVNGLRVRLEAFISEHPDFGLVKMLLSGSLAKGMALRTINDVDVAVYVEAKGSPADEATLLDWLATRLRKAYPNLKADQVTVGDHVVKISFRGTGLDVEVLPVHYEGLPDDRGYVVARDTGRRVLTSIPLHLQFIRRRKQAVPNHFAQVVRFMKWWARQKKTDDSTFRFKSFMIEMICARLVDGGTDFTNYPDALEHILTYIVKKKMQERISFTDFYDSSSLPLPTGAAIEIFDPVNETNNVAEGYSEMDRRRIVVAAEEALDALAEARYATTKGRAVECWQRVLGPSFHG